MLQKNLNIKKSNIFRMEYYKKYVFLYTKKYTKKLLIQIFCLRLNIKCIRVCIRLYLYLVLKKIQIFIFTLTKNSIFYNIFNIIRKNNLSTKFTNLKLRKLI